MRVLPQQNAQEKRGTGVVPEPMMIFLTHRKSVSDAGSGAMIAPASDGARRLSDG